MYCYLYRADIFVLILQDFQDFQERSAYMRTSFKIKFQEFQAEWQARHEFNQRYTWASDPAVTSAVTSRERRAKRTRPRGSTAQVTWLDERRAPALTDETGLADRCSTNDSTTPTRAIG